MTDLQVRILDQLNSAKLGIGFPDSLLRIAADLIPGKKPIVFDQWLNRSAYSEISSRLGFPLELTYAIQGANSALEADEDRRRFAMTLFSRLPVGGKRPILLNLQKAKIVASVAVRIHPLVCKNPDCTWDQRISYLAEFGQMQNYQSYANEQHLEQIRLSRENRCLTALSKYPLGPHNAKKSNRDDALRFLVISEHVENSFVKKDKSPAPYAFKDILRLIASHQGIEPAVSTVVEIAQRCGMATEVA
jgi:hypothetical protein